MSSSLDVNLLLYASDLSSPHHSQAEEFLRSTLRGGEILYVAWMTAMSYLRMATHPRIFATPLSPAEALDNIRSLIAHPRVEPLAEKPGFLEVYTQLTSTFPVRGNLVPDAHLAALLHQHGITTIYTNDADFRKFEFLRVVNPLKH